MKKVSAIVVAAGKGSRMNSIQKKQFMELGMRPVLYYCLKAFEESSVDEIILVVSNEDISYCKKEIVEKYGLRKVKKYVAGGRERADSVKNGVMAASGDVVMIHDGARPCIRPEQIQECIEKAENEKAFIMAVPVKDTIKVVNENGDITDTPRRSCLYAAQTPQVFLKELLLEAYEKKEKAADEEVITDDALLVERYTGVPVRIVEGSYQNIKITTQEDLKIADDFLKVFVDNEPKGW